jgi:hypothetical protein
MSRVLLVPFWNILLMIAESGTEEKDIMVKVVVNLINKKN